MKAKEVFKPDPATPADPGRVFYTITPDDTGKRYISTTAGVIDLGNVIGYVQRRDVGKRLYRVPNKAGDWWFWQAENDTQRDARLARQAARETEARS